MQLESLEFRDVPAVFYVSNSGSDSNTGDTTHPFQTIQHAADLAQAGDTVVVRAGNYAGFVLGWDSPTAGTATKPILFEADPTAASGSVVINSQNSKTHVGIDIEPGCDYITVQGFTVDGSNTAGGLAAYPNRGYGIKVTGDYDQVLNNTIKNLDYAIAGIHDNGGNNVLIQGNTITGVHNHGNSDLGHGIYVANATGVIVNDNIIHDNDYIGIHINGDPNTVTNALIENNLIYNNGQNGINADGLQNSTIQNNLIYGYASYGIAMYYIDSSGPSKNNVIVNNTIVSTQSGAGAAIRILDAGTGNTILNNVLLGGGGVSLQLSSDSMSGLVSDYNIGNANTFFRSEDSGTTQTLAQWQATVNEDPHTLFADPSTLFTNPTANDYTLKSGSPAIDAGTTTDAPRTDILGNARTGNVDIGAYSHKTGGASPPPVSPPPSSPPPVSPPTPTAATLDHPIMIGATFGTDVVRVLNADGSPRHNLTPYSSFLGGIVTAAGDVNGDGVADIVTTATLNGHLKLFDGITGQELWSFFAFPGYNGQISVTVGDITGDNRADVIVSANLNGHVKAFDGTTGNLIVSYFAYPGFNGTVAVAVGDVLGNGRSEIITAADAGAGMHIKVVDLTLESVVSSFMATGPGAPIAGYSLSAIDLNETGADNIVIAQGSQIWFVDGATQSVVGKLDPFPGYSGPVTVEMVQTTGWRPKLISIAQLSNRSHVKMFDRPTEELLESFFVN